MLRIFVKLLEGAAFGQKAVGFISGWVIVTALAS